MQTDVHDYSSLIEVPKCPICGMHERKLLYTDPRYSENQNRNIVQCATCGMAYVSPLRLQDYVSLPLDNYADNFESVNVLGFRYHMQELERALRLLSPGVLNKPEGQRHLLEVGCGAGYFLDIARARGWEVVGIELWTSLVEWSRKYLKLDIRTRRLEEENLPRGFYDVVSMSEVIEHLPDPVGTLRVCREHLRDNGVLFLTCPNFGSKAIEVTGWTWDPIDPYGHIQYFTKETLQRALTAAGFGQAIINAVGGKCGDEQLMAFAPKG